MNPRFLLCNTARMTGETLGDGEMVRSPIECLDRAGERSPDIIVVRFSEIPVWKREALIVLCAALKRNNETKGTPILALLSAEHRQLTEDLHRAGVDFIKYVGHEAALNRASILDIIDSLGQDDHVEGHLAALCPYLHYTMIDPQQEMTVCGAYLDRMVLGGRRLGELCKSEDHLHCEYFLNPRRKT